MNHRDGWDWAEEMRQDCEEEIAYHEEREREAEEEAEARVEEEQRKFDEGFDQWQRQEEERQAAQEEEDQ